MDEPLDWSHTTFEGNRLRQREAFRALSFLEKLTRIEQMNEIARYFAAKHGAINCDGKTLSQRAGTHDRVQEHSPEAEPG